jgi:hypothetical protein
MQELNALVPAHEAFGQAVHIQIDAIDAQADGSILDALALGCNIILAVFARGPDTHAGARATKDVVLHVLKGVLADALKGGTQ